MGKTKHSVHTFMFPFQWDYLSRNPKHNITYNNRTRLRDFDRLFSANSCLKKTLFKVEDSTSKYSEYTYFYPFVRKALYYTKENDFMRYYELDEEGGVYNIEYKLKDGGTRTLSLTLDSICMHVFDTGVGVLSFNLSNYNYSEEKDILIINDYGRRIYPQFLVEEEKKTREVKNKFLANKIYGHLGAFSFEDNFEQYEDPIENNACFLPPQHIRNVFGYSGNEKIGDYGMDFVFRGDDERKNTIRIRQITDDRMFFLCYYNNGKLANSMAKNTYEKDDNDKQTSSSSQNCNSIKKISYAFELDEFWYSFVFGDNDSPSVKDDRFQREQIIGASYTRWIDHNSKDSSCDGTLFGITKDSFVCLGAWFMLETHMLTMYYQMAVLCLVQRASVLRFSYEITQVTRSIFKKRVDLSQQIKEIYENYIAFLNQIYFREVTSQIQGIELYSKFQEAMNLEKEVKDLDNEIQELFEYQNMEEQQRLNRIASLFLPITLITSFLGMNTFGDGDGLVPEPYRTHANIIVILIMAYVFYKFFNDLYKRKK